MEGMINTLIWAALIQGVLLSGLYLFSRKYRSRANTLLGLFLFVIIFEATLMFIPYMEIGGYRLHYFSMPEVKLFYPLFFFHYVLEKLGRSAKYRLFLRIHYGLAISVASISVFNYFLYLVTGQQLFEHLGIPKTENIFMAQQYYAFLLVVLVFSLSIREVFRYKKVVQEEFSDQDMLNIQWLWRLIAVIFPVILMWGANLYIILTRGGNSYGFEMATWGFVIIFLYFVSFEAFRHKNLFEGVEQDELPGEDRTLKRQEVPKRVAGTEIPPERKAMIDRIQQYMEKEEPYLDASLSIYRLSRQLKMDVTELSHLINHTLDQHFFDFVNSYRIKKAMQKLEDSTQRQKTVLEILYEVGFNSKSSFNTVFKKFTGKTPTEYRNVHLKKTS